MYRKDEILVSVAITTYNHEAYILKCVESALNQNTNFKFEIVIGDDYSKDRTGDICEELAQKYPNIIRLYRNKENLGLRKNNFNVWSNCKGRYIAYLEGDDAWTDSKKLQKQINFLENNLKFMGSGHQTILYYGEHSEKNKYFSDLKDLSIIDFEQNIERWLFSTCSFVFRNFFIDSNLDKLRKEFCSNELFWSDRPLMVMCSLYGDFIYHNENMGFWRQHDTNMTKIGNSVEMNLAGVTSYNLIAKLYPKHRIKIKELVLRWSLLACEEAFVQKRYFLFLKLISFSFFKIRNVLGLKNFIKSFAYILRGIKIYS